jgi:nucleoside-diphosphate-sugar epimerase
MRVAVTGANGFLGRFVVHALLQRGLQVRAWSREPCAEQDRGAEWLHGGLENPNNVDRLLTQVDVLVHLAGRAHAADRTVTQRQQFIEVNVGLTTALAHAAIRHGVRRFVFASSIGVLGMPVRAGALTETSTPNPQSTYARTKLTAEQQLFAVASGGLEITVVRPTLIFGPRAPGNVRRLLRLAASGVPLPLGNLSGKRSFVGVRNLSDLFVLCCTHPQAVAQTFVAADDTALSVPEILEALGAGLGRRVQVWSLPAPLLSIGARLLGRSADLAKLSAPLLVDASKARTLLGWQSSQTLYDSICETAMAYRSNTVR